MAIERGLDDIKDLLGQSILLELASTELDPKTKLEKETIKDYAHSKHRSAQEVKYEGEFEVPDNFGEVGAIFVTNEHHREMFIKDIVLDGFLLGPVKFTCESWVHSKYDNPAKRVFFSNKSYLPSETPEGVKRLREEELEQLRGNGQGERKSFERIYDYDVYNDLGDPDSSDDLKRPVLGGNQHPYPRRCRTGRPRCDKDPLSEKRSSTVYVPRDESFSEVKQLTFSTKTLSSGLKALVPALKTLIVDKNLGFPVFSAIDDLFDEGLYLPPLKGIRSILPRLVRHIKDIQEDILLFDPPATMNKDRFFWLRDEEFGRQTLAGLNPCCIQLVTEWPLKSKLDPEIYGPAESAITTEIVEREIRGFNTVEEAIKQKKLFILDYHDLLLPLVKDVRELEGTTLYGSRALFFLTREGTLRPLAIELTRPPMDGKPQWKEVFTPCWHSTGVWLWRLAKLHILAHDSGYHQLVSHWLRTHCATEPYILATNRQLSAMHPIYRLLHPHFRYTMEINALAREALINGDGIIESSFSPGKHSILLSSIAYDQQWQFDLQSLPKDLISRGMAVMTVLDILSNHSPDEEYLGETVEPAWEEEPLVKAAFEKFRGKLIELEGIIDARNADRTRRNRNGAGIVPYELLKPSSEPGVTGKGVPYSISI
ncbi:Linoleate 13S-lipoxygenase 2-1, chloroplastic [Glycine soja]|nr:Linoleate 13S-lipoxygenase 2-1, chloroplastic [Glycine soja]